MPELSTTELGVLTTLPGVGADKLEKLARKLLWHDKRIRFIGWTAAKHDDKRRLRDIRDLGVPEAIQYAAEAIVPPGTPGLQPLGVDIVRGQAGSTNYTRPKAEDAPRDETSKTYLENLVHAHIPLAGDVRLTAAESRNTHFIEPGKLAVARFGLQYAVRLLPDVVNLEVVLGPAGEDPAEAWETYCKVQPSPILD